MNGILVIIPCPNCMEKSHEEVGRFCTSERNAKAPPLNAVDNEKSHEEVGRFCTSERNARTEESRNSPRMSEYINLKLQIKEWQSKCLGMEKRLQASQERTKFLTKKNQELQEMLTETTKLNMDLQRHVINFFEQSEDIEAAKHDTQQNLLQNFPSVGFLRKSDSMIHVGQGLWLPKGTYDAVVYNARKSKRIFVKNMSLALFGPEILKNSSVEGRVSNRRKNSSPKSPLDPVKLRAITDIFQHYLELLKCSSVEIDLWLRRVGSIISSKISDLNRPPRSKKSDHTAEEMDDDEQEKNYQQENYQQENYQQEDCDQENYQQEDCDQENYQQEDCEQNSEQGKNDEENHKDDEFIYEFLDTNLSNSVN